MVNDKDKLMFARYALTFHNPLANILISNPDIRDPREIMEELRKENPYEHAMLSEYIVLPERKDDV